MMQLSDPTYLWALLGLLIPLAIHLLSRKAGRVVQVGSIRHLTESSTRRFKSIRFNEYLLFALRAFLIVLFVLLLAGLTFPGRESKSKWALIEGDPVAFPVLSQRLDSLEEAGYELRSFSNGFPLLSEQEDWGVSFNYPYLLWQLGRANVEAIVLARNRLQAFPGRPVPLPGNVRWLQLPGGGSRESIFKASRLRPDTVSILQSRTGPNRTEFIHRQQYVPEGNDVIEDPTTTGLAVPINGIRSVKVLLISGEGAEGKAVLLEAALDALSSLADQPIQTSKTTIRPAADTAILYDAVVNLSTAAPLEADGLIQITTQATRNGELLEQIGAHFWRLDPDLNRQRILQEDFLVELGQVLMRDETMEEKIKPWDQRVIDESVFFDGKQELTPAGSTGRLSLDKWLILLLILTLILERVIAFYRKA